MLMTLLCAGAQAAVTNPSFETGDMSGWTSQIPGGYGAGAWVIDTVPDQANTYPTFPSPLPGTADGHYYGNLSGYGPDTPAHLWQDVGALVPDTTYTLTIAIGGGRYDWSIPAGHISLINGTDQTGTVLATADETSLNYGPYPNTFRDLSATFTTGAGVSGDLTILITTVGGYSGINPMRFDNVRLVAEAVPEPTTLGLAGIAIGGLLSARRRTK